jgi:hypothetical protein
MNSFHMKVAFGWFVVFSVRWFHKWILSNLIIYLARRRGGVGRKSMRDEKIQIAALPNIVRHSLQVSNCSFSIRIFISKLIRKRNILVVRCCFLKSSTSSAVLINVALGKSHFPVQHGVFHNRLRVQLKLILISKKSKIDKYHNTVRESSQTWKAAHRRPCLSISLPFPLLCSTLLLAGAELVAFDREG